MYVAKIGVDHGVKSMLGPVIMPVMVASDQRKPTVSLVYLMALRMP